MLQNCVSSNPDAHKRELTHLCNVLVKEIAQMNVGAQMLAKWLTPDQMAYTKERLFSFNFNFVEQLMALSTVEFSV
jgi:hypothetical protein